MSGAFLCNMDNNEIQEKTGGRRYDVCLMNPPYSKSTLHIKFIEKCLDLAEKTVVVCPAAWLDDYFGINNIRPSIRTKYSAELGKYLSDYIYYKPEEFQRMFGIGTWNSGMIGVFEKTNKNTELYKDISKEAINKYDEEIINKVAKPLLDGKYISGKKMYRKHKGEDGYDWFIKLTRVHGHVNNKDQYDITAPDIKYSLNVKDKEEKEIYFKSKNEAVNFFESIKTTFCKYLKKLGCYSGDFNSCYQFMNDYTEPWTTHRFCEYFGISKDTEDYIERFFKEFYKSFEK